MSAHYEIQRASDGETYFNLVAENGQIVLTSERYAASAGAEKGIAAVQRNGGDRARFEPRKASDGRDYFVLKAANGEIIGTSQMYASAASMESGIASVMRLASTTQVVGSD
jgi:uncharacterized protein YegP (UPF0339 family)